MEARRSASGEPKSTSGSRCSAGAGRATLRQGERSRSQSWNRSSARLDAPQRILRGRSFDPSL